MEVIWLIGLCWGVWFLRSHRDFGWFSAIALSFFVWPFLLVWALGRSVFKREAGNRGTQKERGVGGSRDIWSPEDAEKEALRIVLQWGYRDARLTPGGADGGVDIVSKELGIQVKRLTKAKVGSPMIQQIYGAAQPKQPVFFACQRDRNSHPYSDHGVAEAERLGVALFGLLPDGTPVTYNSEAKKVRTRSRRLR